MARLALTLAGGGVSISEAYGFWLFWWSQPVYSGIYAIEKSLNYKYCLFWRGFRPNPAQLFQLVFDL